MNVLLPSYSLITNVKYIPVLLHYGTNYGSAFFECVTYTMINITNISSFRYFILKQLSNHLVHLLSFEADIPVCHILL